jgi:hypothetical protein
VRFIGVYTSVYSARVPPPSTAVIGLVPRASVPMPVRPAALAHAVACAGLIRSDGSGLCFVRAISASYGTSMIWLKELAEAAHRKVPPSAAPIVAGQMASGAMTWPAAVVITTKPLRRLLESSMYTLNHAPGVVGGGFEAFPARATGAAAAAAPPLHPRAARRSSGAWPRDNLVSIATPPGRHVAADHELSKFTWAA